MSEAQTEVVASTPKQPKPIAETAPRRVRTPRVDVAETAEAFHLTADVPGVPMEAVEITVEEERLDLRARRPEVAREGYELAFRQIHDAEYRRSFRIPGEIDRAAIRADLRDGVLRITLPKAKSAQPQKIQVHAA